MATSLAGALQICGASTQGPTLPAHADPVTLLFQRTQTGDLMARAINDINAVRMASGMGLVALVDGAVLGMAAIGFMISINLKLTLIALIPAPLVIILTRRLTRRMSKGFDAVQNTFADLTEQVREVFAGIRVIKAYGGQAWETENVRTESEAYVSKNISLARTLAVFFPMMTLFTNTGLAIVILLGGRYAILGRITPGDFVAFISYLNLLTWPMMAMGWVTNLFQRGSAAMRRINHVLEAVPEIEDHAPSEAFQRYLDDSGGSLRDATLKVNNLTFQYANQAAPALDQIEFTVPHGETTALVGSVGSGKTTLLRIIPRLIDVPPGRVFLSRWDIREVPLKWLRSQIGFVSQDVFLFSDTIRNNVVFGQEGISDSSLKHALHVAGILEEVEALEKGVETLLGERGISLSGGQRQRLTIARAVLTDAPILILDDALSMVDTRTEARILDRVLNLPGRRTLLIVSHRVSTIRRADRILVLHEGKLVEQGTHDDLIRRNGRYAALYEAQLIEETFETEA
ncbi:MAG: ABC transporter ATP-binding protein [Deltaproteobacteria bacterium]|nr:ABC transporter ATP-binding protein [Deltaproteobacteria bacterium]